MATGLTGIGQALQQQMQPEPSRPREEGEPEAKAKWPYMVPYRTGSIPKITLAAGTQILRFNLHAKFSQKKQ